MSTEQPTDERVPAEHHPLIPTDAGDPAVERGVSGETHKNESCEPLISQNASDHTPEGDNPEQQKRSRPNSLNLRSPIVVAAQTTPAMDDVTPNADDTAVPVAENAPNPPEADEPLGPPPSYITCVAEVNVQNENGKTNDESKTKNSKKQNEQKSNLKKTKVLWKATDSIQPCNTSIDPLVTEKKEKPEDYMVLSIVSFVLCGCVLGGIALFLSHRSRRAFLKGQRRDAKGFGRFARCFGLLSIAMSVSVILVIMALYLHKAHLVHYDGDGADHPETTAMPN